MLQNSLLHVLCSLPRVLVGFFFPFSLGKLILVFQITHPYCLDITSHSTPNFSTSVGCIFEFLSCIDFYGYPNHVLQVMFVTCFTYLLLFLGCERLEGKRLHLISLLPGPSITPGKLKIFIRMLNLSERGLKLPIFW